MSNTNVCFQFLVRTLLIAEIQNVSSETTDNHHEISLLSRTSPASDPESKHPWLTIINSLHSIQYFSSVLWRSFLAKCLEMKAEVGLIQRWQTSTRMIEHLRAAKSPQPVSHVDHSKPLIPAYYFKLIKAKDGGGGYFRKACAMGKSKQTCFGWFCVAARIYLRECNKKNLRNT